MCASILVSISSLGSVVFPSSFNSYQNGPHSHDLSGLQNNQSVKLLSFSYTANSLIVMASPSSHIHFAIPNGLSNRPGARPEPSTPGPTPVKHTLFHILTPSTKKQESGAEKGRLGEHNGDGGQGVSTTLASTTATRKHAGTLSPRDTRRGNGDDGDNVHNRSGGSHHGQRQDLSHMYMVGQKIQE